MKHLNKFMLPVAALVIGLASCEKDEDPTPTPTPTTTTPTAPAPPTPQVNDVNGAMIALDMDFAYTQMGYSVPLNTQMGIAAFYATNSSFNNLVDAGTVKINGNVLEKQTNNSYLVTAGIPTKQPEAMDLNGTITWDVTGANGVPAINRTLLPGFPNYTPAVPTDISKANGLVLNFNSGTVSNADSVYVMIISGDKSILRRYAAGAGSVNISSSDMTDLPVTSTTSIAYIEIVPWKVSELVNVNNKFYAFIKEKAIVRTVNITN